MMDLVERNAEIVVGRRTRSGSPARPFCWPEPTWSSSESAFAAMHESVVVPFLTVGCLESGRTALEADLRAMLPPNQRRTRARANERPRRAARCRQSRWRCHARQNGATDQNVWVGP